MRVPRAPRWSLAVSGRDPRASRNPRVSACPPGPSRASFLRGHPRFSRGNRFEGIRAALAHQLLLLCPLPCFSPPPLCRCFFCDRPFPLSLGHRSPPLRPAPLLAPSPAPSLKRPRPTLAAPPPRLPLCLPAAFRHTVAPPAPRLSPRTLGHQKRLPTQASTPGAVQHLEPPVPLPRVPPRNLHPARSSRPSLRVRPPHLAPLARPWRTPGTPFARASRPPGRNAAPLRAPLAPPRRLRRRRRPRTSAGSLGINA